VELLLLISDEQAIEAFDKIKRTFDRFYASSGPQRKEGNVLWTELTACDIVLDILIAG
jgi:hypothetical protein